MVRIKAKINTGKSIILISERYESDIDFQDEMNNRKWRVIAYEVITLEQEDEAFREEWRNEVGSANAHKI